MNWKKIAELEFKRKSASVERAFRQNWLKTFAWNLCFPLAGPVVAAAVILPKNCKIRGLNDSKKIPKKKHLEIYQAAQDQALSIGIGIMDNQVIDQVNIYEATKLAMKEAISQLSPQPEHLLIDAMQLDLPISQTAIIKGDANSLSIAAASIVAKVTRDSLMKDYDNQFPGYDFAANAGYGTENT